MCGIAGVWTSNVDQGQRQLVEALVAAQFRRGPDHQQIIQISQSQTQLILGHNRLSIVDLSAQANQPMWDETERYCLVYNGEIYNYIELRNQLQAQGCVFKTSSDTEVILQAIRQYGLDIIQQFNGPFAFAWYDRLLNTLTLVRDRFGVKPLYYYQNHHGIYFASSMTTLAQHFKLPPNYHYIQRGLNYYCYETDSADTAYLNLYSVQPGYYLTVSFDRDTMMTTPKQYYDFYEQVCRRKQEILHLSENELTEQLRYLLDQAVRIRLRADVPIGIALSGGLDSATVAALAARETSQLTAFCFGDPDDRTSEGSLAQQVAQQYGIRPEFIRFDQCTPELLIDVMRAQEAPFASLSIIAQYLVYQRAHHHGIKVILGGQGGDEALMGYRKYFLFYLREQLAKKNYIAALGASAQLGLMLAHELSQWSFYWSARKIYSSQNGFNSRLEFHQTGFNHHALMAHRRTHQSTLEKQVCDITMTSLPTLLRYEERNAMANSIESRLPFMDYQLLEYAVALPASMKLRQGYGKFILRQIMDNQIPNDIRLARYKRGFDLDTRLLIQQGLGHTIRTMLHDSQQKINQFLPGQSSSGITALYSDQQLQSNPLALREAMALLWLASP
jgi:asparagine synthase (glutamine-hydrolysing)